MPEPVKLSLTNFLNFSTKAGVAKMRFVEQVKKDEQFDFYGPMRDHIKQVHESGQDKMVIQAILETLTNKQKIKCYPPVVKGYQKFWGKKEIEWVRPPKAVWSHSDIVVNVTPELGLVIDGQVHVIKLYFRQERLTKERVCTITHLLEQQLRPKLGPDVQLGILDVQRAKLLQPTLTDNYQLLLESEAEMFRKYWDKL